MIKEKKIKIDGWDINFLKAGTGPHAVVCLPGTLGTIWSNFRHQIEGFDHEKFTVVAWDPPGYGKSRPPDRTFTPDFYEEDAEIIYKLMKTLKIPKYSLLGWCAGAITGIILAAKYPEAVEKLVLISPRTALLQCELDKLRFQGLPYCSVSWINYDVSNYYYSYNSPLPDILGWCAGAITGMILAAKYPEGVVQLVLEYGLSLREIGFYVCHILFPDAANEEFWSKHMDEPTVQIHGMESTVSTWTNLVECLTNIYNTRNGDICSDLTKDIKCPTLILYGQKDPVVDSSHITFINTNIKGSRLHLYPDGKHNIHILYPEDFNKRVQEFLLEEPTDSAKSIKSFVHHYEKISNNTQVLLK
ncbi:alpha/beta hydrolase fold domain-containing protein [Phthorimaea operculella]|nr:alpha/beta hydrolase fold domain-containing protein [Phthorimaea operculella]